MELRTVGVLLLLIDVFGVLCRAGRAQQTKNAGTGGHGPGVVAFPRKTIEYGTRASIIKLIFLRLSGQSYFASCSDKSSDPYTRVV